MERKRRMQKHRQSSANQFQIHLQMNTSRSTPKRTVSFTSTPLFSITNRQKKKKNLQDHMYCLTNCPIGWVLSWTSLSWQRHMERVFFAYWFMFSKVQTVIFNLQCFQAACFGILLTPKHAATISGSIFLLCLLEVTCNHYSSIKYLQ